MKKVGIDIEGSTGIGDKLQFASLPEAYYRRYGVKLIDINKEWVFDHNPYVMREEEAGKFLKLRMKGPDGEFLKEKIPFIYSAHEDWHCPTRGPTLTTKKGVAVVMQPLNLERTDPYDSTNYSQFLYSLMDIQVWENPDLNIPRSPRLYKYEDCEIKPNQIVIHVGPNVAPPCQFIPSYVLEKISERYSNYDIIQIGSKKDNDSPFIDKRGIKIWDSVKIIAESAIFICVNSGPMNMANCYPRINKKLILMEGDLKKDKIQRFFPRNFRSRGGDHYEKWVDYGWQYYNSTGNDLGVTYSYKRI